MNMKTKHINIPPKLAAMSVGACNAVKNPVRQLLIQVYSILIKRHREHSKNNLIHPSYAIPTPVYIGL